MIRIVIYMLWLAGFTSALAEPQKPVFPPFDSAQAEIGRLLFYDKVLSGNRNISCGTCHHPAFGTTDALPLGVGEGGAGVGPARTTGSGKDRIERRVPRNAPALWNLGAKQITRLMHDGRISESNDYGNHFNTPAQEWLPQGLNSVLAAQALFPMTSETEMAGSNEENEVAGAANDRIDNAWPIIAKRVRTLPDYGQRFVDAFDDVTRAENVSIVHVANALAAFMATEFKSLDSPYDQWIDGDRNALNAQQQRGMSLFFGAAQCSSCHSGALFSSHQFKALALPPFGPGRTRAFDPIPRDVGRMGESDRLEDAYRFRVPMLRNVALTAPYGHNGAYDTLYKMIQHHTDPLSSRQRWSSATSRSRFRPSSRRSNQENEMIDILKESFRAYSNDNKRTGAELAALLAKDWICLKASFPGVAAMGTPPQA
ncbi:MAG: cytochrome c peroxidase, partial [Pseudomonadota bacterium]